MRQTEFVDIKPNESVYDMRTYGVCIAGPPHLMLSS